MSSNDREPVIGSADLLIHTAADRLSIQVAHLIRDTKGEHLETLDAILKIRDELWVIAHRLNNDLRKLARVRDRIAGMIGSGSPAAHDLYGQGGGGASGDEKGVKP